MIDFPNAKINIGLHVVERRNDGFHNIETVFYPVPFYDVLEIISMDDERFTSRLYNYGLLVNTSPEDNLCMKAYKKLRENYDIPPVSIYLYKNIPFGAGLGGGSSDATKLLQMVNELFKLNLSSSKLSELASSLGSDCSFFLYNSPCLATQRGERLEPFELNLSGKYLAIVKPEVYVSTAEAYKLVKPSQPDLSLREIVNMPVSEWKDNITNDFELSIFKKYPVLKEIKDSFYRMGALYASMSGSGSSIFGLFDYPVNLNGLFNGCFVWSAEL
jgi:4-diphosphocytidyl-2-C-methyl-D-erythritol kinase